METRVKIWNAFAKTVTDDLEENKIEAESAAEIWSIGLKEYLIFKRPLTPEQIALKGITVQNISMQNEPKPEKRTW